MILWRPTRPFRTNLFIIGDWNAKVGSQETPGVTDNFGLGVQSEAGQRLIEFCPKNVLFIIWDWNAKVGSQETPGVTGKFGFGMRNEAGQRLIRVLPKKCTGHSKHKRTLHMDITRWSAPKSDWLYSLQPKMEKLYTVNKNKTRSWLWLRSWDPYYQIQMQIEENRENH